MMLASFQYALRRLMRSPGYTLSVLVLLAVVIAANSSVFSVIYALKYKPLAFEDSESSVLIESRMFGFDSDIGVSTPILEGFAANSTLLKSVYGYRTESLTALGDDAKRIGSIDAAYVQPGLFLSLGARPEIGRMLMDDDASNAVVQSVVISWAEWQKNYAGSESAIGKVIRLESGDVRIIGVMDSGFGFPSTSTRMWLPLSFSADERHLSNVGSFGGLRAVARLKSGVSSSEIDIELNSLLRTMPGFEEAYKAGLKSVTKPLRSLWLGDLGPVLGLTLLAVSLVLLVTVANICNLFLARVFERKHETALMSALGASAWRRIQSLLLEAAILCVGGSLLGVMLLPAGLGLLRYFELLPLELPQAIGLDVASAVYVSLICVVVFTSMALCTLSLRSGIRSNDVLKAGSTRMTSSRAASYVRQTLIVIQVSLSMALLVGVGLLLRSSQQLLQEDVGFDRENLLMARIYEPVPFDATDAQRRAVLANLRARAQALPGVQSVAFGNMLPFSGDANLFNYSMTVDEEGVGQAGYQRMVSEDYFSTIGTRILRGREFSADESRHAADVAIVDESFVRRHFAEQDPIGQRLYVGVGPGQPMRALSIVGVVTDVRQRSLASVEGRVSIYQPDNAPQKSSLIVRSKISPAAVAEPLSALIREMTSQSTSFQVVTMHDRLRNSLRDRQSLNGLLQLLAGTALALAAFGLYAVMAYGVRMRRAEFGVRMALGADPARVQRSVLAQGLRLLATGIMLGMPLAWAISQLLASRLHRVGVADPTTLISVVLILSCAGVVACWWPSRHAANIEPMLALRNE